MKEPVVGGSTPNPPRATRRVLGKPCERDTYGEKV